jgi:hypothetical protein
MGQDTNHWLDWASNGREILNSRGKLDQRKSRESSTVTKLLPETFVPIFLRTDEDWVCFQSP